MRDPLLLYIPSAVYRADRQLWNSKLGYELLSIQLERMQCFKSLELELSSAMELVK